MEVAKQLAKLESVSLPIDCGNFLLVGVILRRIFSVKYQISINSMNFQAEKKKTKMKNQDSEMKKMRFSEDPKKTDNKKKSPQRPSIVSNYSFVSLSEVTEGSLQVWRTLPEKIRQDPSLASFRQEHERLHGESTKYFTIFSY